LILDFLRQEGFTDEELARIYAPAGLDLGAREPEEIALSVLAEVVMLRRGGDGRSMRCLAEDSALMQRRVAQPEAIR
jgi:xanthine dehydrogenase accessory factor